MYNVRVWKTKDPRLKAKEQRTINFFDMDYGFGIVWFERRIFDESA